MAIVKLNPKISNRKYFKNAEKRQPTENQKC